MKFLLNVKNVIKEHFWGPVDRQTSGILGLFSGSAPIVAVGTGLALQPGSAINNAIIQTLNPSKLTYVQKISTCVITIQFPSLILNSYIVLTMLYSPIKLFIASGTNGRLENAQRNVAQVQELIQEQKRSPRLMVDHVLVNQLK